MDKIKEFMNREWTVTEKIFLLADVALAGILIGWLTSPVKGFFSNNVIASLNGVEEEYESEDEEE